MNTEERPSYMGLVFKIILVVGAVIALMWFFPMPNMKPVYDRLFNDNINSMKNAAKSYYTVDRLPKDLNGKATMSLQEMIDNKLVLPIIDSQGKACDTKASYVEVMRAEKEYLLKVSLSCPTRTDYIIEHLGCYNLCNNNGCNNPESALEYQFSRTLYKGYKIETADKKKYEFVKYEEKTEYEYTCKLGTPDVHDAKICNITETIDANCQDGFTKTANNTCIKTIPSEPKTITYYDPCPSGYTATGNPVGSTCTGKPFISGYKYGDTWIWKQNVVREYTLDTYTTQSFKRVLVDIYSAPAACDGCFPVTKYEYAEYYKEKIPVYDRDVKTMTPHTKTTYNCTEDKLSADKTKCIITGELKCPTDMTPSADKTKCTKNTTAEAEKSIKSTKIVTDTQWSFSQTLAGYTATGKSIVVRISDKKFTDWLISLPDGYTRSETKIEYKWWKDKSLDGWTSTGLTRPTSL